MFERFTDLARRTIVVAQDEARSLGHGAIMPAHLFLALSEVPKGLAGQVMAEQGVSPDDLRQRVSGAFSSADANRKIDRVPFSPKAKKSLELSLRESLQLGHNYIGTEHILLGLLRQAGADDPSADDLYGVAVPELRRAILQAMSAGGPRTGRGARSPALTEAFGRARALAGPASMTTGHLLEAILEDPGSHASTALAALGVDAGTVHRALGEVDVAATTDAVPPPGSVQLSVGAVAVRITDPGLVQALGAMDPSGLAAVLRRGLADPGTGPAAPG